MVSSIPAMIARPFDVESRILRGCMGGGKAVEWRETKAPERERKGALKCEFRAIWKDASPKSYPVRLFPNNLAEYDDGLAHAVDNTLS